MRQRRLVVLCVVMIGLIVARWCASYSSPSAPVVEAVVRPATSRAAFEQSNLPPALPASIPASRVAEPEAVDTADAPLSDPFAVRPAPQPVVPQAPTPVPIVVAPAPPADPAPPYQVIGTYDDSQAPGLFVATSGGVEIARVGGHLGADFTVTAITRHSLTLEQVATKRVVVLNVPGSAAP